jgi:hypothetical protein
MGFMPSMREMVNGYRVLIPKPERDKLGNTGVEGEMELKFILRE